MHLPEGLTMRMFITACIAAAVVAVIAAIALSSFQETVQTAFSTSAVRL